MARDHDHRCVWKVLAAGVDDIETIDVADSQIHDDQFGFLGSDRGHAFSSRETPRHGVASGSDQLGHELQNCGFVVYDYYFSHKSL